MAARKEPIGEAEKDLLEYLEVLRAQFGPKDPEDWVYRGPADYLLRQGCFFERTRDVGSMPVRMPKYCFANAYAVARSSLGELAYAEGVARSCSEHGCCHFHAWCVDGDGRVVDPTWIPPAGLGLGSAYFGVVFALQFVAKVRGSPRKSASVIDNWRANYPLLRRRTKRGGR